MKEFVGEFEKSQPSSGVAGIGLDSRLELSTKQFLSWRMAEKGLG